MRINRYLSLCGLGSRRGCEALVRKGEIKLNGTVVDGLAVTVDLTADTVTWQGRPVRPASRVQIIILNKPVKYVSSRRDEIGRNLVYELLPPELRNEVQSIGRLDFSSRGLLLFTNYGELSFRLMHPSFHLPKTYEVECLGVLSPADLDRLRQGIELEDGLTLPAEVTRIAPAPAGHTRLRITLYEGRQRQIRRMLQSLDRRVTDLRRIQLGPLSLGNLAEGAWRPLTPAETKAIFECAGLPVTEDFISARPAEPPAPGLSGAKHSPAPSARIWRT
jgi:pseudouridine synthase